MATYKKLPSGKWQAQVARKGVRKSKTFPTRLEAKDWATHEEYLATGQGHPRSGMALGDLFERYGREVSPRKRGKITEIIRLEKLRRDRIAGIRLDRLKPADFADWRDRRLEEVAPGSVNREMVLMSGVLTVARKEWGLIASNPMTDVRKPSNPPPRDRRVSDAEIAALLTAGGDDLDTSTARAVHAFRFAIETAMRAGEIVRLAWDDVDRTTRVAHLAMTKNGTARKVPLSTAALGLLDALPRNGAACFGLKSQQLDVMFRKARERAGIENLRFHDSRHEAITRLAKKLDVLSLARMVGHRDIRMLQVYYNETAEELAQRLD